MFLLTRGSLSRPGERRARAAWLIPRKSPQSPSSADLVQLVCLSQQDETLSASATGVFTWSADYLSPL